MTAHTLCTIVVASLSITMDKNKNLPEGRSLLGIWGQGFSYPLLCCHTCVIA